MKMKKLMSGIVAATLAMSMSVPAFALGDTDVTSGEQNLGSFEGTVEAPAIKMSLPTFNGQSITFDVYNQTGTGKQVISPDFTFTNKSAVPVTVTLVKYTLDLTGVGGYYGVDAQEPPQPTKAASGDVAAVATPGAVEVGTTKNVFLWFNEANKDIFGETILVNGEYSYPEFNAVNHAKHVLDTESVAASDGVGILEGEAEEAEISNPVPFAMLERGAVMKPDFSGTDPITDVGTRNSITLKLDGALNTKAAWAVGDKIEITPVFSIDPVVFVDSPVISANITQISAGTAAPVTVAITGEGFRTSGLNISDFNIVGLTDTAFTAALEADNTASKVEITLTPNTAAIEGKIFIAAKATAYASAADNAKDPWSNYITIAVQDIEPELLLDGTAPTAASFRSALTLTVNSDKALASDGAITAYTLTLTKAAGGAATAVTPTSITVDAATKKVITIVLPADATVAEGDTLALTVKKAAYGATGYKDAVLEIEVGAVVQSQPTLNNTAAAPTYAIFNTNAGNTTDLAKIVSSAPFKATLTAGTDYTVKITDSTGNTVRTASFTPGTVTVSGSDNNTVTFMGRISGVTGLAAGDIITITFSPSAFTYPSDVIAPDPITLTLQ